MKPVPRLNLVRVVTEHALRGPRETLLQRYYKMYRTSPRGLTAHAHLNAWEAIEASVMRNIAVPDGTDRELMLDHSRRFA